MKRPLEYSAQCSGAHWQLLALLVLWVGGSSLHVGRPAAQLRSLSLLHVCFFDVTVVVQLGWPDSCRRQTEIAPAPQADFQSPSCRGPGLALTLTLVSVKILGEGRF